MQAEFRVGPQVNADGALVTGRGNKTGEQGVSDVHAKYQEAVLRGGVFHAANSADRSLSLASATATGIVLSNPAGSGKNLVVIQIQVQIALALAAVSTIGLFANTNPLAAATVHTTPIPPVNALLGGGTGVGLADSAATLPAVPTLIRALAGWHWVTGNASVTQLGIIDYIDGAVILAPGTTVSVQGSLGTPTVRAGIVWEEITA